jgi:hypothetical protein
MAGQNHGGYLSGSMIPAPRDLFPVSLQKDDALFTARPLSVSGAGPKAKCQFSSVRWPKPSCQRKTSYWTHLSMQGGEEAVFDRTKITGINRSLAHLA